MGTINYSLYVKQDDLGWATAEDGRVAGTVGRSMFVDAFGLNVAPFKIQYQIHVANRGWLDVWTHSGENRYQSGNGNQLEAIKFRFPEGLPENTYLCGRAHVATIGWMPTQILSHDNPELGTTGKGLRLEAIQLKVEVMPPEKVVQYRKTVQDFQEILFDIKNRGFVPSGSPSLTADQKGLLELAVKAAAVVRAGITFDATAAAIAAAAPAAVATIITGGLMIIPTAALLVQLRESTEDSFTELRKRFESGEKNDIGGHRIGENIAEPGSLDLPSHRNIA